MFSHAKTVSEGTSKTENHWLLLGGELGDPKMGFGLELKPSHGSHCEPLPVVHRNIRVTKKSGYLGRKEVQEKL